MTLALLLLYFIGFHLRLSYRGEDGSTLVPMYSMLIPAALLLALSGGSLVRRVGNHALALLLLLLAQPLLALAPGSGGVSGLRGGLQLFASVLAALIVINAAKALDPRRLRRMFVFLWGALIGLALLENFGLRATFFQIRESLYGASGRGIYASDFRDLQLYGQIRPTALASEPSFLAASYMTAAVLVFMLDSRRGRSGSWVRLILMSAIGFAVAPSASVGFYLAAAVVWHFWPRRGSSRVGAVLVSGSALALLWAFYGDIVTRFAGQFGVSETGSFYGRVLVGPRVASQVLTDYPLFGFGVGNTEGLYPRILGEWYSSGAIYKFPWFRDLRPVDLMTNGFWWQWSLLGLLGGLVFTVIVVKALAALGVPLPLRTLVCTWIVWYAGAAFVDPASWCAFAVFAIPALLNERAPDRAVPDEGDPGLGGREHDVGAALEGGLVGR